MRWRNIAVLALAVLAVGCSSKGAKELPPAELTKFKPEVQLNTEWSRSIGDGQGNNFNMLEPVIDGGNIIAADAEGVVVAMDRYTGKVVWNKKLKVPVSGAVGAAYGKLFIGTLDGELIALSSDNGEELWRARAPSEILSAPGSNGDVVVVQTLDDSLIAYDAYNGERRWIYENNPAVLTLRGTGSPLVTDQLVLAGLSTGKVIALEASRGLPIWEQRVAVPQGRSELERIVDIDGGLLLVNDVVYAVSYQGRVAAMDLQTGRTLWQREASSSVGVAQNFGNVYVSLAEGTVESIDERSTSALWANADLARRQLTAPAVFSGNVAVGDFEGYLHLLSEVDGRFVARERIDSKGLRARPLVDGSWLYVYGNGGKLVALTIR